MDPNLTSSQSPIHGLTSGPNHRIHRHVLHVSALPLLSTMAATLLLSVIVIVLASMGIGVGSQATSLLLA